MLQKYFLGLFAAVLMVTFTASSGICNPQKGQTLYVPAYSSIYHGIKTRKLNLTSTLFVHNVNLHTPITLESVKYFNSDGKLVSTPLPEATELPPLATRRFIIPERDTSGGTGANFLVEWSSEKEVNTPLIECLMVGSGGNLGVSFVIKGTPIDTTK